MKRLTAQSRHDVLTQAALVGDGYRTKALAHNRPVNHGVVAIEHKRTMRAIALVELPEIPEMVGEDYQRLSRGRHGGFIGMITSASKVSRSSLPNSARLSAVTEAIRLLGLFNAGLLEGGQALKTSLTDYAWKVYFQIEVLGMDDSHWQETYIPCNEYNQTSNDGKACKGSMYTDLTRNGRARKVKMVTPDSTLAASDQYLCLSLARKFTLNRD